MQDNRQQLRRTFDEDALLYDQARPGYPAALYDDIVALTDLPPRGRILEIGCGTGQATLPFARRGYNMLCVELGENLAAVARRNLAEYPLVQIQTGAFEDWRAEPASFDLVISATAFHWVDHAIAYPKMATALRPDGAIALFWNKAARAEPDEGFFEAAQEVYQREAPELAKEYRPLPLPAEVPADLEPEIAATGLFGPVVIRRYAWSVPHTAASYLRLLDTFPEHRRLPTETRRRLYDGIADLIERSFQGHITRGYLTLLYVARKNT